MKTTKKLVLTLLAMGSGAWVSMAAVQDKAKGATQEGPKPLAPQFDPAGMQKYMEMCTPDFHHKKLGDWLGAWDTETRIWEGGPGSKPMVSKGTATFEWLAENRWLQQKTDGQMMGFPLRGFGLLGFDKYKQKYVGSWCDSMTTTLLHFEGNFDRTDKTLLLYGSMDEPMSGEHDKCVKYVWRLADKDKMVFEVHDLPIGEENTKVVEITYTRKK
jgi:hypothetical protein